MEISTPLTIHSVPGIPSVMEALSMGTSGPATCEKPLCTRKDRRPPPLRGGQDQMAKTVPDPRVTGIPDKDDRTENDRNSGTKDSGERRKVGGGRWSPTGDTTKTQGDRVPYATSKGSNPDETRKEERRAWSSQDEYGENDKVKNSDPGVEVDTPEKPEGVRSGYLHRSKVEWVKDGMKPKKGKSPNEDRSPVKIDPDCWSRNRSWVKIGPELVRMERDVTANQAGIVFGKAHVGLNEMSESSIPRADELLRGRIRDNGEVLDSGTRRSQRSPAHLALDAMSKIFNATTAQNIDSATTSTLPLPYHNLLSLALLSGPPNHLNDIRFDSNSRSRWNPARGRRCSVTWHTVGPRFLTHSSQNAIVLLLSVSLESWTLSAMGKTVQLPSSEDTLSATITAHCV
ncbi:hypothetical protein FB45DRAFT_1109150 [Roridomyces roridus]|uniref:Uncharacterized protein n=1 Tax=Roridomyces roridus TaxID=1738132 RepID=A0AAD7FC06_9AGAR|nr:hypothetical protein FB45DRAFT_1109150 [Roridomyces roridus]